MAEKKWEKEGLLEGDRHVYEKIWAGETELWGKYDKEER